MFSRVDEENEGESEWDRTGVSPGPPAIVMVEPSPTNSISSTASTPVNPTSFSPPASIISFSGYSRPGTADYPSGHSPTIFAAGSPGIKHAPDGHSRNGSIASHNPVRVSGISVSQTVIPGRPSTSGSASRGRLRESFDAPPSRPILALAAPLPTTKIRGERMRSTMLPSDSTIQKPWLDEKRDPYSRIAYFLTYGMVFLGIAGGALRCFFAWRGVRLLTDNLCLVMEDNFDGTELSDKWMREVQMDGFGNGEFAMMTSSNTNSFVRDGHLYITPTLTSDVIGVDSIFNGYTLNLTDCTYNQTRNTYPKSTSATLGSSGPLINNGTEEMFDPEAYYRACGAVSNSSTGAVISPIQSARLSTRNSASIKYGKVEVRAKLPSGDWLWPAIWMLPVQNTYGPWPMSGEIDIMESRGNWRTYPKQGQNYVRGSLNWGPFSWLNQVYKTYGWWSERRGSYADTFHTYNLEWTEKFIRIYVDTRLHYMLDLRFNIPFFQRGDFPLVVQNASDNIILHNPWQNGSISAPFDQKFYLIMNVAVGGTSGWFPDNAGEKPWLDGSLTAMRDFAKTQDQWYRTWPQNKDDRSLVVDYVKMWEKC